MRQRQRQIENDLYEKWKVWIERIYSEVVTLFAFRSYYQGLAEMTQANNTIPPSSFFDALGSWYGITQATGIRRQVDLDDRAVSVVTLLTSIARNPGVMTRERHLALYEPAAHWQARGSEGFDSFAGAGNDTIAPERTLADMDRLLETARPVKDYVDRLVAHNDQRELDRPPTYGELNTAIDLLGELLNKYMVLLKASSVPNADPVHQHDWRDAFRVAWLLE